jgi:choline-sulfatase
VFWLRGIKAVTAGALLVLASFPVLAQKSSPSSAAQPAAALRPNIILISVDTLRADRVSCFSPNAPPTPNIDKLCHGGTSFSQVSSMVPLTLPSHVAMLTSTYPFVNGVEDNGDRLAPGAVTLASTLQSHGYRTAAFIGGFVLDRRFGLDQGFETYDSPSESRPSDSSDPGDIKRKGEAVALAGEAWLSKNSSQPFFAFVHIYDLHTPYNLTAAEKTKYGDGYEGELGYIDHVIGDLWDFLLAHDLVKNSLIVFTADHGEGLGEHGETTHGFFIYQSTLHVPFIIHWPSREALLAARIDTSASLLDVSPTILDAIKIALPKTMQGRSLLNPANSPEDVYSESLYPEKHFSSSPLMSLRSGHYKYIDAPRPEFYDLAQDPGELTDLSADKASLASAYRERLRQLRQAKKPHSPGTPNALSPEAVEKLHALGYLTGGSSVHSSTQAGIDPKDRIADYEAYGTAIELASVGRLRDSDTALTAILAKDGGLQDVRLALGLNEQRLGKDAEAVGEFKTVLAADPASAVAHLDAGLSYYALHNFEAAGNEASATLAISPGYLKAEILLARSLAQEGKYESAASTFNHILLANPDNYEAHDGLGTLAAMRGDWDESVKQLQAALAIEPAAADTHATLGNVYLRKGEIDLARGQFEQTLRIQPNNASAHYALGLIFVRLNQLDKARDEFQKSLSIDPTFHLAQDALARMGKTP